LQHNFPDYTSNIRMATFGLYCGLIAGVRNSSPSPAHLLTRTQYILQATFWGMTCDVIGRRLAWNATLFLSGIFGIACVLHSLVYLCFREWCVDILLEFVSTGAAPNFVTLCGVYQLHLQFQLRLVQPD
jgi:hypothetical protein